MHARMQKSKMVVVGNNMRVSAWRGMFMLVKGRGYVGLCATTQSQSSGGNGHRLFAKLSLDRSDT